MGCCLYLMCMDDIHHCVRSSFCTILFPTGIDINEKNEITVHFDDMKHDFLKVFVALLLRCVFTSSHEKHNS